MLISEFVRIEVNPRNKRRFKVWGFPSVEVGDIVDVPIDSLSKQSTYMIAVKCDYCGLTFSCHIYAYNNNKKRSHLSFDCCALCRQRKVEDTIMQKYGVKSTLELPDIQQKIKHTCMDRYGVEYPLQRDDFIQRAKCGMLQKYGVSHNAQLPSTRQKFEETMIKKYGVKHALQNPELKGKALQNQPHIIVSSQQEELYSHIKDLGYDCELNYRSNGFVYDVAVFLDEVKIDVEYDGHWWHKDRLNEDKLRDKVSNDNGWMVIRFRPAERYYKAPTKEQIDLAIKTIINENRPTLWVELAG